MNWPHSHRESGYEHGGRHQHPTVPQMQPIGRPMDGSADHAHLCLLRRATHSLQGEPRAQALSHLSGGRTDPHHRIAGDGCGDPIRCRISSRLTGCGLHGSNRAARIRSCRRHTRDFRDAGPTPPKRCDHRRAQGPNVEGSRTNDSRTDLPHAQLRRLYDLGKRHNRDVRGRAIQIHPINRLPTMQYPTR